MKEYKCFECDATIDPNDHFCHNCGKLTTFGYSFFGDKNNDTSFITNGLIVKQNKKITFLIWILVFFMIIFSSLYFFRGKEMYRPIYYIEKQVYKYKYGYNVSLFKTDNQYFNKDVYSIEDAYNFINKDLSGQDYKCENNLEVFKVQERLKNDYKINSINFCDISFDEVNKIANVIDRMYILFPEAIGYLTNISITNASEKDKYIAYFQPLYQFVNSNSDSNNKVNKTQILLNSYYFLNHDILNSNINEKVDSNWYVNDANWESQIAHEFGHYISFVTLLKEYKVDNIVYENQNNKEVINKIIEKVNSGDYSTKLVNKAYESYVMKNECELSLEDFALRISKYAGSKNKDGKLIADETIAEAIHDYFLHGRSAKSESLEIVNEIKSKLRGN